MAFDDHGLVVVLDEVVKQLIQIESRRSGNPHERLEEWASWLKARGEVFARAAFSENNIGTDSSLNALEIAGAFDEFAEDLLKGSA